MSKKKLYININIYILINILINMYNIFMYIYDILNYDIDNIDIINYIINNKNEIIENYNNLKNVNNDIHYKYYKIFNLNLYKTVCNIINNNILDFSYCISYCIPPFKLLISDINYKNYGCHRYGWKNVIYNFLKSTYTENDIFHFNNPNFEWIQYANKYNLNTYTETIEHYNINKDTSLSNLKCIIFDDWLEISLTWNYKNKNFNSNANIISFIHDPPVIIDDSHSEFIKNKIKDDIFLKDTYIYLKDKLKILITLTESHKLHLQNNNNISNNTIIENILHPLEITETKLFNPEEYINNNDKKIYLIGWWLRKFDTFINIKNNEHKKIILIKNVEGQWVINYVNYEIRKTLYTKLYDNLNSKNELDENEISNLNKTNTFISNYISNEEYDNIFKNNLVFLDFYSTSANNALLECILTNTPVLIKNNPSTVEYLGKDYPLFFDTLEEADKKLNNTGLIISAHYYLKNISKNKFTYNLFNKKLSNIIINNI